jgi:hypothetical protein
MPDITRAGVSRYRLESHEHLNRTIIHQEQMMGSEKSLSIPPVAQRDKASFEVLRVWIAEQGQHVSLQSGAWEDPFAWGIVLADLARHIAHAHKLQNENTDEDVFMSRLLEGFQAEIDNPTDEPEGEVTQ